MKKKLLSMLLCAAMVLLLLPTTAFAKDTPTVDYSSGRDISMTGPQVINSGRWSITMSSMSVKARSSTNGTFDSQPCRWLILGGTGEVTLSPQDPAGKAAQDCHIIIEPDSNLTLRLNNISLDPFVSGSTYDGVMSTPCIAVQDNATLKLLLVGENTLGGTNEVFGRCGIGVAGSAQLIIEDDPVESGIGVLNCYGGAPGNIYYNLGGAGIGPLDGYNRHGAVTVNGGVVNAIGGTGSAGIGGVYQTASLNGGNVTINGGTVYAEGRSGAAAIGGAAGCVADGVDLYGHGGHVRVTGGTLTAKADVYAQVLTVDGYQNRTGMVIGTGANAQNVFHTKANGEYVESFTVTGGIVSLSANAQLPISKYFPLNAESYAEESSYLASHIQNCILGYARHDMSGNRVSDNTQVYGSFRLTEDYTVKAGDAIVIPSSASITVAENTVLTVEPTADPGGYVDPSEQGMVLGRTNSIVLESGSAPGRIEGYGHRPQIVNLDLPALPEAAPGNAETMSAGRVTYLAVVQPERSTDRTIIAGNSAAELAPKIGNGTILTIMNAGRRGFEEIEGGYQIAVDGIDTIYMSLTANGSLTAVSTTQNAEFTITEANGEVTATGEDLSLASSSFTVFSPKSGTGFELDFSETGNKLAFTATFDPNNNNALISIPELFGSSFMMDSISPVKGSTALRFGGKLALSTPVLDVAGINITKLQLDFAGGSVTLGGIAGEGAVDIPKIAGFVGGKAETRINTFIGEGTDESEFMFSVEAKTPVFDGEFYLDFAEAYGVILPNSFYMAGKVGAGGIPLVPPTTVAYITGGGLGVYGLAETIGMKRFALPPIRLRMTGSGSIVDVMEGTLDLTTGPGYTNIELSDIELADMANILEKVGIIYNVNLEQYEFGNIIYDVAAMHSQMYVEAGLSVMDYEFLEAYGNVGFDVYAGLSIDAEGPTVHSLFRVESNGELGGSLKIPKGIILGLPFNDIKFANVSAGYHLAGTVHPDVNLSDPWSAFSSEAVLDSFTPEGSVAAMATFNVLFTRLWVRGSYVFGASSPSLNAGVGDAPPLMAMAASPQRSDLTVFSVAAPGEDRQAGEYAILQANARTVADTANDGGVSLMSVHGTPPSGVTLTEVAGSSEKSYNASVGIGISDPKQIMFVISSKDEIALSKSDFTVTTGGSPVTLTEPEFDGDGVQSNTPNFAADGAYAYFTVSDRETYTITCTKPVDIQAVLFTPYATLGTAATENNSLHYTISDYDAEAEYTVKVYLGKEDGGMDYLLAEGAVTTATGTVAALPASGTLAPSGSYYLTAVLMENTSAVTDAGDTVSGWVVADKHAAGSFSYTYNNPLGSIGAPANATLAYSGNETMTASWTAVADAEGYLVTIYDADGAPTGVTYRTDGTTTSVVMALTEDARDAQNNIIPGLAAGSSYSVGVKAFKAISKTLYEPESGDNVVLATELFGVETLSETAALNAAEPPALSYSQNVTLGAYGSHTLLLNTTANQTFTVTASRNCTFTVTNLNDKGTPVQVSSTSDSVTVTVPVFEGSIQLEIVAKDSESMDYAAEYVTVRLDKTPPVLTLNDSGQFYKSGASTATVTGQTEAYARVCAWNGAATKPDTVQASADGTFSIELIGGNYTVEAVDLATNRSQPVSVTVADGSTVTPAQTSYTRYTADTVTFSLTPHGDAALTAVKYNGTELKAGSDYTVSDNSYTLKNAFLDQCGDGAALLTFDMSKGNDPTALLTVIPNSPPDINDGGGTPLSISDLAVNRIKAAKDGETVKIEMGSDTKLEARVFETLAGRDVTLEIQSGSVTWTVKGTDIPEGVSMRAIDMGVTVGGKTISVDIVNALTGEKTSVQLELKHSGPFGFEMIMTVFLGKENAGMYANLYQYNTTTGKLEFRSAAKIDASGNAGLKFNGASEYVIVIDNVSAEGVNPFTDVKESDYYYNAILWAVEKGITNGTGDGTTFRPADSCTRAQMAAFLWRAAGSPEPTTIINPFTDVKADAYYYKAVLWAVEKGITLGSNADGTTFSPNDTCTRGQMAAFLYRYAGSPAVTGSNPFTDVAASDYYCNAVIWAATEGVTQGTNAAGTTFSPKDDCTRGQIVTFLYRLLGK